MFQDLDSNKMIGSGREASGPYLPDIDVVPLSLYAFQSSYRCPIRPSYAME